MIKPTVLIVDDEPLIALMVDVVFEEAGFEVITAASAAEAADQIGHRIENLAAIVTDIQLGKGPNGWAVAVDARARLPRIPIVYMTGDSAADWTAFGVRRSVLVQKPFVGDQVLAAVMTLMNEDNISEATD